MTKIVFKWHHLAIIVLALLTTACASYLRQQMDEKYGESQPRQRTVQQVDGLEYHQDIEPIMAQRCVVCHGCYDAPCQLKLEAFEGLDRGASKDKVYLGSRLVAANMSRLFEDSETTSQWREKGFYPVLNERNQNEEVNLQGSVLYRLLALKRAHPLPEKSLLDERFDLSLDRKQQCPSIEQMDQYEDKFPQGGMPYGLPGLNDDEFSTIMQWLAEGAQRKQKPALDEDYQALIDEWEGFFNGDSLKQRLMSRYIFEHLFVGHLFFGSKGGEEYFALRRSSSPPGKPIKLVSTRRPFDDPGVERVYYRLQRIQNSIVAKRHMPYRLDAARMLRWREVFLESDYIVDALPDYEATSSANPFITFSSIPAHLRYQFLLDEAQFTIMGFIKGPVCRGQIALSVIQDRFWVVFVDPENELFQAANNTLDKLQDFLHLPAGKGSNALPLSSWRKYSKLQKKYLAQKKKFIFDNFPHGKGINMDLIWNGGEQRNKNAALTILRHFDSATVVKGFVGEKPKTAWIIGYSLLERIHYLLVAGYDVYGNLGHQLVTRLYMDFLRMEGEQNFLMLLPEDAAQKEIAHWYQGAESEVENYIKAFRQWAPGNSGIHFQSANPKQELFDKIIAHLGTDIIAKDPINRPDNNSQSDDLVKLARIKGSSLSWLPEVSILRLNADDHAPEVYTLVVNRAHSNVAQPFSEGKRILSEAQSLTLVKGVLGDYPNAFYSVNEHHLPAFIEAVAGLSSTNDYTRLMDRFGVRRTDKSFWAYSDWLNGFYRNNQAIESGILDYNRLVNQ